MWSLTRLCPSWRSRSYSPRSLPWQAGESVSQASAGHCNDYINLVRTRSNTWSSTKMYFTFLMFKAWERYVSAGRTCRLEKCGFNTKDHEEFEKHLAQHKEDLKKRLICNQVGYHPYARCTRLSWQFRQINWGPILAGMSDVQVQTILSGGLWSSTWRSKSMAGACGGAQSQAQDKDHQFCEVGAANRIRAAGT